VAAPAPSIHRVTDSELVDLARQGDTAAFGELVERHEAAVLRTALAVCRSREEAEEVAQDAFVAAWQKLDGFRGEAQFKTWLLTIAWRHALTRRTSLWQRLRRFTSSDDEGYVEPVRWVRSTEQALADAELTRDVRRLLATLPVKLREPLLLAAAGDCTFEEMSRMLGVPAGTLKWRVMEARRRLKQKLAAAGYELV
jgi:RNA polymerase sigma-70 factor, ECF subfamily